MPKIHYLTVLDAPAIASASLISPHLPPEMLPIAAGLVRVNQRGVARPTGPRGTYCVPTVLITSPQVVDYDDDDDDVGDRDDAITGTKRDARAGEIGLLERFELDDENPNVVHYVGAFSHTALRALLAAPPHTPIDEARERWVRLDPADVRAWCEGRVFQNGLNMRTVQGPDGPRPGRRL